jgi:hypothetical protein
MDADALLAAYAAAVAGRIGHTDLTVTSELRDYGRRNFTPLQFLGVFPADLEPPRTRHRSFYVQNTDPSSKGGEHWIAVGREPGRSDLVFDSFGRTPGPGWMGCCCCCCCCWSGCCCCMASLCRNPCHNFCESRASGLVWTAGHSVTGAQAF